MDSGVKYFSKTEMKKEHDSIFVGRADYSDKVVMAERVIGKNWDKVSTASFDAFGKLFDQKHNTVQAFTAPANIAAYGSVFAYPMNWSDGKTESVMDRVSRGGFVKSAQASTGNTLIPDWNLLWDAVRLDITMRKNALPTIRQLFYNVVNRPDADKSNKLNDLFQYSVVFEENSGSGQAVRQGDKGGGRVGNLDINIYAAGFMWDLVCKLFDKTLDMTQLSDAVAVGYNAIRDNMAIKPILDTDYGTVDTATADGTKHWTKANAMSGADRQELLYNTINDAFDALAKRPHPQMKGRKLNPNGALLLMSGNDARHARLVASGLPSTNQKYLPAITSLGGIVEYDGEIIPTRDGDKTYAGVTDGYAYLCIPAGAQNKMMNIMVKQGLTVEVDMQPDVKTLAQEEYAYWFAEGIDHEGTKYFVQKITLPAW